MSLDSDLFPQKIDESSQEIQEHDSKSILFKVEQNQIKKVFELKYSELFFQKISYGLILLAMFAISSGGTAFKFFPSNVPPILACFWRSFSTCICLFPFTCYQLKQMGSSKIREHFTKPSFWFLIITGGIGVSLWTGTFAFALYHTSLTNVYLLNNLQPIFILIWNKYVKQPISLIAIIGVLFSLGGLVCTIGSNGWNDFLSYETLFGEGVAFSGSIFAAIYIISGKKLRSTVPSFIYLFPVTLLSLIFNLVFTLTLESTSPSQLFIWVTRWDEARVVLWLCLITSLGGNSLVAFVMKYLPCLVISVVLLCEPIVATVISICVKIEPIPNWPTWLGAGFITFGILLVTLSNKNSNSVQKLQKEKEMETLELEMVNEETTKISESP